MRHQHLFPRLWLRTVASITVITFLFTVIAIPGLADELRLKEPLPGIQPEQPSTATDYSSDGSGGEQILLPDIGSSSDSLMTPAAERRLGARFMQSVRGSLPVLDNPLLSDYIQRLGRLLVVNSDAPNSSFHFFLIDQDVVNAFAGPGGYIGIYTGLILEAQSESELASVIAHEIAHVTQHHLFRAFEQSSRMSGPAAIMLLGAVLLGAAVSPDAGIAAAAGVQAGLAQKQINFTRSNEQEADRVGIKTLANAGFDPRAMPMFFQRMAKATRVYESNAPEFLRTHPVTTNRIADALGRAEAYPYKQEQENLEFYLVRAILRLRQFDDPGKAVTFFRTTLDEGRYRNQQAQRFGYALALMRDRKYSLARKQIQRLLRDAPDQIAFLLAEAELDHRTGDNKRAVNNLETALELYPGNFPLVMAYAGLLIDTGQAAKARQILLDEVKLLPDNASLYKLLAQAAGEAGDLVGAHQYQAEYYYLQYQLEQAIQQLRIALRSKDLSFYQSSQLEAKLKQFEVEKKDRKQAL